MTTDVDVDTDINNLSKYRHKLSSKRHDNSACTMTLSFKRAFKYVNSAIISGHTSICVYGCKGVGKTYLIHQIAAQYCRKIVSISVSEQLDMNLLIGGYVCTDTPGDFIWKPGVLLSALQKGEWIILEDIHLSSPEFMLSISSILETRKLVIFSRNITFDAHPDFMIFATMNMSSHNHDNILNRWFCIHLETPTETDLIDILQSSFPHIATLIPLVLRIFFTLQSKNDEYTTRDLFKICSRITISYQNDSSYFPDSPNDPVDINIRQHILQSFLEVAILWIDKPQLRLQCGKSICEQLSLPITSSLDHYLISNKPVITECNFDSELVVRIGDRYSVPKYSQMNMESIRSYSWTGMSLRLLEAISGCIELCEPVLLLGETGTGKTTLVQQLARLVGIPLKVVNVHVSTELNDLIGGYKPIISTKFPHNCYKNFMELFFKTFSVKKNTSYIEAIQKAAFQSDTKTLQKLFDQTYKMAFQKLDRNDSLLTDWKSLEQEFKIESSGTETIPLFSFVEGVLTESIRLGNWILLDEINLASHEVLEYLDSLLSSPDGSITLYEKGDITPVPRHPRFHIFACMNPPSTDTMKRDLPPSIKSRFTSLFVDELDKYPDDLYKVIESACTPLGRAMASSCSGYSESISPVDKCKIVIKFMHSAFYRIKNTLSDGSMILGDSRKPLLTLRTITRVLDIASRFYQRQVPLTISCLEGWKAAFLSQLDQGYSHAFDIIVDELKCFNEVQKQQLVYKSLNMPVLSSEVMIHGYALPRGALPLQENNGYILVPTVQDHLHSLCRVLVTPTTGAFVSYPILVEGPTSCGKTSLIQYLAEQLGHQLYRINNHEHTDAQEYMGSFVYDHTGKIVFRYGILVQAMRNGGWLILDELNLAPSDVLEALNRLLDDNQELYIPETNEYIHPHSSFRLFATQNPSDGVHRYAGRKRLSRAFRNRFMECYFKEIPRDELLIIIQQTCPNLASSFCKRIIEAYQKLIEYSKTSATNVFLGSHGFITLRDLFKWTKRTPMNTYHDIAQHGYMLLAERLRRENDKEIVKQILEQVFKVQLMVDSLYSSVQISSDAMIWTPSMKRAYYLIKQSLSNNEPVLLVGETGLGKTSLIQWISKEAQTKLQIVNCHMYSEASDFIGMQRPSRSNKRKSLNDSDDAHSFSWQDGPLLEAMKQGNYFLLDEINLAEDSVLERLNPILESSKSPNITISSEYHGIDESYEVISVKPFAFFATMNPGGDYGKRELSPALRNRFTEIYIPPILWHDEGSKEVDMILNGLLLSICIEKSDLKSAMIKFIVWFSNTHKDTVITIRDLHTWTQFIKSTHNYLSIWEGFVHGAKLAFLDRDSSVNKSECINKLLELSDLSISWWNEFSTRGSFEYRFTSDNGKQKISWGMNPFHVTALSVNNINSEYVMNAPTVKENAFRILTALIIQDNDTNTPRSILLEGDPGVGKTSLIQEIGRYLGHEIVRINLSEDTDLTDLFGKEVPCDSGNQLFRWQDGPFLSAMKRGDWIILDELNLACQSVLEGLNACLDHRGSIFISELGKTFYIRNDTSSITKIFATQNPIGHGGRKGLPKSFLNRFIRVVLDPWTKEDFPLIVKNKHVDPRHIEFIIDINQKLSNRFHKMDFNLRDISRCLKLFNKISSTGNLYYLLISIYYTYVIRFPIDEQPAVIDILHDTSCISDDDWMDFQDYINYGRHTLHNCLEAHVTDLIPLPNQLGTLNALKMSIECHFLSILSGPTGCGKSWMIKYLSILYNRPLHVVSCNSMMDPCDFLGSFERDEQFKGGKFVWTPGILIHALRNGHWLLLDNAHLCPAAVLDRLASLFEKWPGELHVHESSNGSSESYEAHPDFHVFMTVQYDASSSHISRPMRNRGMEIYQDSRICELDIITLLHPWIIRGDEHTRHIYDIILNINNLRSVCKSIKCLSIGDLQLWEEMLKDTHVIPENNSSMTRYCRLDFMIYNRDNHPIQEAFPLWIESCALIMTKHCYWKDTVHHIVKCLENNEAILSLPVTKLVHELLTSASEYTTTDNFVAWILSSLKNNTYRYSDSSTLFVLLFLLKSAEYIKDNSLFFIYDAMLSHVTDYEPNDIPLHISSAKSLCMYWRDHSNSMITNTIIDFHNICENDTDWKCFILYLELFCLSRLISSLSDSDKRDYYLEKTIILLKEASLNLDTVADGYILDMILKITQKASNDYFNLILVWIISIFSRLLSHIDRFIYEDTRDLVSRYLHQLASLLYGEQIYDIHKIHVYHERSRLLVLGLGFDFLSGASFSICANNGPLSIILGHLRNLATHIAQKCVIPIPEPSNNESLHWISKILLTCFYPFDYTVDPSVYESFQKSLVSHSYQYKLHQSEAIDFCRECAHGIESNIYHYENNALDIPIECSRTRKESIQNDLKILNDRIDISLNSIDNNICNVVGLFSNDFWSILDITHIPLLGLLLKQILKFMNLRKDVTSSPQELLYLDNDNLYKVWRMFLEMSEKNEHIESFLVEKTYFEKSSFYSKLALCKKRIDITGLTIPTMDSYWMLCSLFEKESIEGKTIPLLSRLSNELHAIRKSAESLLEEYDSEHSLLSEIYSHSTNISFSKETLIATIHSLITKCIEFSNVASCISIRNICEWLYEYQWNDIYNYKTYQISYKVHRPSDGTNALLVNMLELILFNSISQDHNEIIKILDKFLLGTTIQEFHTRLNWLKRLIEMKVDIPVPYHWIVAYYSYYHSNIFAFLIESVNQTQQDIQKNVLDLYFLGSKSTSDVLFLQSFDKMVRQLKKYKKEYAENVINLDTIEWIQRNVRICHTEWESFVQSIQMIDNVPCTITSTMRDSLNLIHQQFYREKVNSWMQNNNTILSRFVESFRAWQEGYLFGIKGVMDLSAHDHESKFLFQLKSRILRDYLKDIRREIGIPVQSSVDQSDNESLNLLFQQLGQTSVNNNKMIDDESIMIPMLHVYSHISHTWWSKECNHTTELVWFFCSICHLMTKIMIPMRTQCGYFISKSHTIDNNDIVENSLIFIQDLRQIQSTLTHSLSIPNIKTFYERMIKRAYSSNVLPWIPEKILQEYASLYRIIGKWFLNHMNVFAILCTEANGPNDTKDTLLPANEDNNCVNDDNSVQGMGNVSNKDNTTNAKNVSNEIECQEQIEGLKNDDNDETTEQSKGEGDAMDIQDDFEGSVYAPSDDMEQESVDVENDAPVHVDELNQEHDFGDHDQDESRNEIMKDNDMMEKSEFLDPEVWKDMDDTRMECDESSKWESISEQGNYSDGSSHISEIEEEEENDNKVMDELKEDVLDDTEEQQEFQDEKVEHESDYEDDVLDCSELMYENVNDGETTTEYQQNHDKSTDMDNEDKYGIENGMNKNSDTEVIGDDDQFQEEEMYEPCDNGQISSDIAKGTVNKESVQENVENLHNIVDDNQLQNVKRVNNVEQLGPEQEVNGETLLCSGSSLVSLQNIDVLFNEAKMFQGSLSTADDIDHFWNQLISSTQFNAFNLVELLSRLLEPTKVGKLQGDYKSGKRLSMKKVIQYIASGYRKDKIWLRRTKLVKSEYNILVHVDTSVSMKELQADKLVLETLAMLIQLVKIASRGSSFTGSVKMSINSFGHETLSILNSEQLENLTELECGRLIMNKLTFSDDSSHVVPCLVNAMKLFHDMSSGNQKRIHFVLTDGVIFKNEMEKIMTRQLVSRNLIDGQIMTVFVLLDKRCTLMDMKQVSFDDGRIVMKHYLDDFPSDYYIVLRDVNDLNDVLTTCISKWIEIVSSHGLHI